MLYITIQAVLLLGGIIIPLGAQKSQATDSSKFKANIKFRIDTDTTNARYAINENGSLERINRTSLSDH
jgi:hypothetical protein